MCVCVFVCVCVCVYVLRVTDVAQWYRWIDSMGLTTLVGLDCQEQFNRVRPEWVVQYMRAASSWLYTRKKWRSSELTWSIHKDHRRLDRAGKACAQGFKYVTHEDLIRLVDFDLTSNNRCTAAGQVWERDGCIPMGGPFSVQAADLHCVWSAYQKRGLFRRLGDPQVSDSGFVYWVGAHTTAMCQFRDNILVATDAPSEACADVVEEIRYVLQTAWGLPVVCECISDEQECCTGNCRGPICKAMGMVMVRGPTGAGMAFAEPAALAASWELKLGPPLLSPGRAYQGYLGAIFTGVLKNGLPFTDSWAAQIFSAAAWLQVAILSGYGRAEAMRAMHKGVYRAYATAPHDVQATMKAVYSVSYILPAARHTVALHISQWLRGHAYWEGGQYSSWYAQGQLGLQGVTGCWCSDFPCLSLLSEEA